MKHLREYAIAALILACPGTALAEQVLICEDMDATGFEWPVTER
jgi:hypothetical protein